MWLNQEHDLRFFDDLNTEKAFMKWVNFQMESRVRSEKYANGIKCRRWIFPRHANYMLHTDHKAYGKLSM